MLKDQLLKIFAIYTIKKMEQNNSLVEIIFDIKEIVEEFGIKADYPIPRYNYKCYKIEIGKAIILSIINSVYDKAFIQIYISNQLYHTYRVTWEYYAMRDGEGVKESNRTELQDLYDTINQKIEEYDKNYQDAL